MNNYMGVPQKEVPAVAAGGPRADSSPPVIRREQKPPIDTARVQDAYQTMLKYQAGKRNLEESIRQNERWYRMRHWNIMRGSSSSKVEPVSGWLFNAIANKHAAAMDNYPAPNILPRERGDKQTAKMLSAIVPVVLEQSNFEETYSKVWDDKLRFGTGCYGVFWDPTKQNGLGDIAITKVDILNLFWEPGVTEIQRSRHVFHAELHDNDLLQERYPSLKGKLGGNATVITQYIQDESVDNSGKTLVVDWYYKKSVNGRTVLHYCKFAGDTVLFATENDPRYAQQGWYEHGEYPFFLDPLFRMESSPCGFGYIDLGKSAQEYIDRGNQAILQNMLVNARPRFFLRSDGAVNQDEYADLSRDFITADGNLGSDSIRPVDTKTLSDIYVTVVNNKIDELKEVTGNRDISTGGTTSGVTAAAAIAAMQEAGSRLDRDANKASYRVFRNLVYMVIELIRQFYTLPRQFRILGERGAVEFVEFDNRDIRLQNQGTIVGEDMGFRKPIFDVQITAQKASPYSKIAQNELALQFYGAGFFNPEMADQALACLDMMDFDHKDAIMQKIAQNGGMMREMAMMQQQMLQLAAIVDRHEGTNMAQQVAASMTGAPVPPSAANAPAPAGKEALGGSKAEASATKKARERVAQSTAPT